MTHEEALSHCLYYKGEDRNPFGNDNARHTYWWLESAYVHSFADSEILQREYGYNFTIDFPDELSAISTPFFMKAYLYNRYYQMGGSKYGFENWLNAYMALPHYENNI